jgi:hypothetical protein
MKRLAAPLLVFTVLILSACATPQTVTVERTVEVPVTVIVPADCPDCPTCTTCITCPTPRPACPTVPTEAPVNASLKAPKGRGSYLVGVDIAPGIWRSSGTENVCYLKLNTLAGETEDMVGDPPGSTFSIPAGNWIVVISGCEWAFYK